MGLHTAPASWILHEKHMVCVCVRACVCVRVCVCVCARARTRVYLPRRGGPARRRTRMRAPAEDGSDSEAEQGLPSPARLSLWLSPWASLDAEGSAVEGEGLGHSGARAQRSALCSGPGARTSPKPADVDVHRPRPAARRPWPWPSGGGGTCGNRAKEGEWPRPGGRGGLNPHHRAGQGAGSLQSQAFGSQS